jgi:hypothetical protein
MIDGLIGDFRTWRCHDRCEKRIDGIGRDAELSSLYGFLDRAVDGPAAFVVEGEPGIGKSTLWLAGVEHARSRGRRVLSARPAEAERGLAHAGLGDLFEDALDDVRPGYRLPGGARWRSRCCASPRTTAPTIAPSPWPYATCSTC